MQYEIKIEKVKKTRLPEVDLKNVVFGRTFADHMLVCDYYDGQWHDVNIMPYQNISLSPATTALHYGQEIFEGLKAYKDNNNNALLFRPDANLIRMNHSAKRMCMPEIPEEIFIGGLQKLIDIDRDWIPTHPGAALYIRPFMFSTDEYVGIKASDSYKFIIFSCPVGAYYPEPIKVKIEQYYTRAAEGGTGSAKAAGNYGASLYPACLGQAQGYKQLLWTDGKEHKWIEESGTMNVFFVIDGKAITPALDGNILDGITRNSVLTLLRDNGYQVEERKISVDEIVQASNEGRISEVFGTGTAATIAHITAVGYDETEMLYPPVEERKISNWLLDMLEKIKHSELPDKYNWIFKV